MKRKCEFCGVTYEAYNKPKRQGRGARGGSKRGFYSRTCSPSCSKFYHRYYKSSIFKAVTLFQKCVYVKLKGLTISSKYKYPSYIKGVRIENVRI